MFKNWNSKRYSISLIRICPVFSDKVISSLRSGKWASSFSPKKVKNMSVGRVGVPLTDRILEFIEERNPGSKVAVWRIFYPMRDEDPIEVVVKPGSLSGEVLELTLEGKSIVVKEEQKPAPRREREPVRRERY